MTADFIQRRKDQFAELGRLLGGHERDPLEVLNEIDQIGIEDTQSRLEVTDAVIASIKRGQDWATGATAVQVRPCAVCEGTSHSRSARGKCRACHGWGRVQVKCRACAEKTPGEKHQTTCTDCVSRGWLDPVTNRETILRQHREWWERTTKMSDEGCVVCGDKFVGGSTWWSDVPNGPRMHLACKERRDKLDVHEGPPERPASTFGVVERLGVRMCWDRETGSDVSGNGAPTSPFRTLAKATEACDDLVKLSPSVRVSGRADGPGVRVPSGPLPNAPASPMPRAIASALFRAQRHIRKVPKASENAGDGYEYTSAEAIIEEARTALHQEGLAVGLFDWTRFAPACELEVTFMLIHETGEQHVCKPVRMPIVEDGGKDKRAPDKALATALTYCESQWLRVALQIPRIGRSEDADARSDVGDGGRRRARKEAEDRTPLSTELNDAVVSMHKAIEGAKDGRTLTGILSRLRKAEQDGLPAAVAHRVEVAIAARGATLGLDGVMEAKT